MTALVDGLRSWWRHRNDPPAWLPDPVRWTTKSAGEPQWFVDRLNDTETIDGHGWVLTDTRPDPHGGSPIVRLIRDDGRYRSRDDGMRGL